MRPSLSDPRLKKTSAVVIDREALLNEVGILVLTLVRVESIDLQPPVDPILKGRK
jgi:hypothetical protein